MSNTIKKIDDNKPICLHPLHKPPTHLVIEPGTYEHTCPACGEVIRFTVPQIIW